MDSFLYLHRLEAINCLVTTVLLANIFGTLTNPKSISSSTIRRIWFAIGVVTTEFLFFMDLYKALYPLAGAGPIALGFATLLAILFYLLDKYAKRLNLGTGYVVICAASSFSLFLLQGPFSALHIITFMAVWLLIGLMIDWHKYSQQLKAVH